MASDIRQYQQMGVGSLILDFIRLSEVLERMEEFATQVWPKV